MIWELLIKTFIPFSRIFGNEDDILIFSRNVQKQVVGWILFKKIKSKDIMKNQLYTNVAKDNRWL